MLELVCRLEFGLIVLMLRNLKTLIAVENKYLGDSVNYCYILAYLAQKVQFN